MLVLALDTTTPAGSLALWRDTELVEVCTGDPQRTHAERLPNDLIALLAGHHYTLADVDRFAVASGPGGFTGLRIGIATIQGLALVGHRPVFAASTLLLLAVAAKQAALHRGRSPHGALGERALPSAPCPDYPQGTLVGAWMQAARGEVFTALYGPGRVDDARAPSSSVTTLDAAVMARVGLAAVEDASVGAPDEVAARWRSLVPSARLLLMGNATGELAEPLRQRFGEALDLHSPPALAGVLATLAGSFPDLALPPHAIVPTYVRRPDAEIARDRMATLPGSRA